MNDNDSFVTEAIFPKSENQPEKSASTSTSPVRGYSTIAAEFKDILKDITTMAEEFEANNTIQPKREQAIDYGNDFSEDLAVDASTWETSENTTVPLENPQPLKTDVENDPTTAEVKATYKLFVRNLPPGILSSELLRLFQPFGKVIECEVFVKNYAFVHMESKDCGLRAMAELNNKCVNGVNINVQEARNKAIKIKHPIGSYGHQKVATFKLYMCDLPSESDNESITSLIEPYGRVVEVQKLTPISAFVHIETEECGKKAISGLHGTVLEGGNKSLTVVESDEPGGPTVPVMRLLIKNVSEKATAAQLRDLFSKYGMVIESKITQSPKNEERKAVVHLEALGDIRSALKEMNGYVLDDLALQVEPILETESKNLEGSLKFKALDPGYGKGSKPPPLMSPKDKFRPRSSGIRPLFADNQKQWRLIPMPSAYEEPSYQYDNYRKPMHLVPPPSRMGGRDMGRNFTPQQVARDMDCEFYTDNYDEFYEAPFQGSQNEEEGDDWEAPWNQPYQYSAEQSMSDQDYSPMIKRAKPRFGQVQPQPRPLMDLPFEDSSRVPPPSSYNNSFSSFRCSAPLNLPLGEKTYFSNFKKDNRNKSNANIPSLMETSSSNNRLEQQYSSQQFAHQNAQSNDAAFSQDSYILPGFYANDQIQGPNSNYWTPPDSEKSSASQYKSNFSFSNMVNNYTAKNQAQKTSSTQPSFFSAQQTPYLQNQSQLSSPSVNSSEYPTLKPGAKVYVNGKGKVMVRGNRGGKRRKPVMAVEMPSRANAKPQGFMRNQNKGKPFSKQVQDQQKLEYATWLEQKPWLHQAIPGTIKRL